MAEERQIFVGRDGSGFFQIRVELRERFFVDVDPCAIFVEPFAAFVGQLAHFFFGELDAAVIERGGQRKPGVFAFVFVDIELHANGGGFVLQRVRAVDGFGDVAIPRRVFVGRGFASPGEQLRNLLVFGVETTATLAGGFFEFFAAAGDEFAVDAEERVALAEVFFTLRGGGEDFNGRDRDVRGGSGFSERGGGFEVETGVDAFGFVVVGEFDVETGLSVMQTSMFSMSAVTEAPSFLRRGNTSITNAGMSSS